MENHRTKTYCFYCQDHEANYVRSIPLRRKDGYKLTDFDVCLCESCNYLDDQVLTDYFNV